MRWWPRRPGARAALLGALVVPILLARSPQVPDWDFCSYYTAGLLAAEGAPSAAFDSALLRARHSELHEGGRVGPFLYSPVWLMPARAFAALPLAAAERWNRWLGAAALGLGLALLLVRIPRVDEQVAVTAAFVLAHPVWVQLIYQNWTFWLFAALAGAGLAAARARPGVAGLLWAGALHLKGFLVLAVPSLWVAGRRRVVAATVACGLLLAALALPLTGTESWHRWGSMATRLGANGVTPFYNKVSVAAGLARLSTPPRAWIAPRGPVRTKPVRAVFWLGLPLLALGLRRLRDDPEAAVAYSYAWILLAVPQIWDHTEILLFLVLPALVRRYRLLLAALLAASFFYNGMLQPMLIAAARGGTPAEAVRLLLWLFPALNLLAAAAVLASHEGRRAEPVTRL